jgi:hypothetical protein
MLPSLSFNEFSSPQPLPFYCVLLKLQGRGSKAETLCLPALPSSEVILQRFIGDLKEKRGGGGK